MPPPGNITLAPLGSPRILISDAATLTRYRSLVTANAPSAVRFKSMVDSQVTGANIYGFEPWYAALMGQITGSASYCTYAVTKTEAFVASEEALINANQRATVAGDSYLEVGPLIGNLALVYDWCRASMTTSQRTRWASYANQAVWNVWNPAQARWGNTVYAWSGWSVNNPVNNYYYSFLEATMLLGLATFDENSQAGAWLTQFRTSKLENQLFPMFNSDLSGGGSREGTGYGTAMKNLWRLYDWWERSTGQRVASRTPHSLASMTHMMHSIVPTLNRLTPTGDHARDSAAELFDYHRDYLQVLMRLYPTERASRVAKSLLAQSSVPAMANRFMYYSDFLYDHTDIPAAPLSDLATEHWGSGTGQFSMRSSWTNTAAYANFICGPYTESHAHRDQGSFTLYKGNWLAYDGNMDSASGIEQDERWHNLVRIESNGVTVTQVAESQPCDMRALVSNANYAYASARITPVYNSKAQVGKVEREFLFIKPSTFVVFDRVDSVGANTRRVWTLNLPAQPTVNGDNLSLVRGANRLDVMRLAPNGLTAQVQPGFGGGYRVDVAHAAGSSSNFLNVLGTDGSVTAAVRSDVAGQTGATLTLVDGRRVTVRFSTAGTGGTIEISNSLGAVLLSEALPTTVQAPALFAN